MELRVSSQVFLRQPSSQVLGVRQRWCKHKPPICGASEPLDNAELEEIRDYQEQPLCQIENLREMNKFLEMYTLQKRT